MGLKFPEDLTAWYKWQQQADAVRRIKGMASNTPILLSPLSSGVGEMSEPEPVAGVLHTRGNNPRVLVVLDSMSPTSMSSLVSPLEFLPDTSVAVWAPSEMKNLLPHGQWKTDQVAENELSSNLPDISAVLALGNYMKYGAAGYRFAREQSAKFIVVQHGLLTPYAPPLPKKSTFLAFSQKDANFYISGRTDIDYRVVGSQLFYDAARNASEPDSPVADEQPIFLGQMHGAELPRASFARAGFSFCKQSNARYRPHPSEKDKMSVLTHALWAKMGITIDRSAQPLNTLNNPVVSVFSTGVLEAAIRGVPAWVYHPNPPQWLQDFWQRYGMSRWGEKPTPAPPQPDIEPARAIAQYLKESLS